ncbi:NACHT domain-containing protein [Streptomyces sp. MNP-20]|uniref:NACHT domain-containing protein n=1 Tax=Streptomyces sp. MNP-20 TaxID=2721165 RepID=UPI001552AD8B|nr:NACHT domain-containing protein [Streptomyces sp. MNP-20]
MEKGPVSYNEFSGTAHTVVQAHTIHGGIHFNDGRRPLTSRWLAGKLVLAVCSVAMGVLLFAVAVDTGSERAPASDLLLGFVCAVLVMFGIWLAPTALVRHRRSRVLWGDRSEPELNAASDRLARAEREQLLRAERLRRLQDPAPIPVRWSAAPDELTDHWENITGGGPVPLAGRFEEIAEVFDRVPSGRLVVLGPAGTGKSVLVVRLALDLLERRRPGEKVPVILPLASWRPDAEPDLWEWAAQELGRRHAGLGTGTASARDLCRELLRTGRLLPVLDGFDELPKAVRPHALTTLNATLDRAAQAVLTSRATEYRDATRASRPLTGAAAIGMRPLTVADLISYLRRTTRPRPGNRRRTTTLWDHVLTAPADDPRRAALTRVLTEALATPLMAALARKAYSDTGRDPEELLDPRRFRDREAIETHLLAQFVPAAYDPSLAAASPGCRWDAKAAHRWLAFLAAHARDQGTREVTWWSLPLAAPWIVRAAGAAAAMVLAVVALVPVGIARPFEAPFGLATVPLIALVVPFAALVVIDAASEIAAPWALTKRGWLPPFLRRTAPIVPLAFVVAPIALSGTGKVLESAFHVTVPLLLLAGGSVFQDVADRSLAPGPRALLRADCRVTLALPGTRAFTAPCRAAAATVCLLAPLTLFLNEHTLPDGVPPSDYDVVTAGDWLLSSLSAAAALLLYGIAVSAWGRFIVARIWLAATGRLPWRPLEFLEDACVRGVLRQTGGVLYFRHGRLQDTLAPPRPPVDRVGVGRFRKLATIRNAVTLTHYGTALMLPLILPELVTTLATPNDERYRSLPPACALLKRDLAAQAVPRPQLIESVGYDDTTHSSCTWRTDHKDQAPSIELVVTRESAAAGESAVKQAIVSYRGTERDSRDRGGHREAVDLGDEAAWWGSGSHGRVIVRQDNICIDLRVHGADGSSRGPVHTDVAVLGEIAQAVLDRGRVAAR